MLWKKNRCCHSMETKKSRRTNWARPCAKSRLLRHLDTSVARYLDEKAYRFFIASYILHDWEKLPGVADMLEAKFGKGFKPDPIKHREVFEQVLLEWTRRLGLDEFLASGGL